MPKSILFTGALLLISLFIFSFSGKQIPSKKISRHEIDSLQKIITRLFKSQPAEDKDKNNTPAYSLDKIYFEPNQTALLDSSKEQLDELVNFLNQFPDVEIMIKGYADSTGSVELNQVLSEHRAQSVARYLINHGVSADRISSMGFGKDNPIGNNNTPEGRRMNRRVEFTVVKQ